MKNMRLLSVAFCLASCAGASIVDPLAAGIGGDVTVSPGSVWTIDNGTLMPRRGEARTYVITRKRFADVTITLDFYAEPGTNSGVFARCQDPVEISPMQCYEFNIWDAHPNQDARTGAIVMLSPPDATLATEGRWNTMRVQLIGNRLQVWINEIMLNDIEDDKLSEGHIAFQYGGDDGMVRFRNIRIREIS